MIYRRKLGYIAMGGVIATVAIVASNGVTPNLYTAIGGVIAIGAMIAASFAAPKLDSQDDDTCVITCSELNVVNEKGISVVRLGNLAGYGGYVNIMDSSGTSVAGLAGSRFGGTVTVGKEENAVVTLSTDEHGGTIVVNNNDGQPIVRMGAVDANGSVGNLAVAGNTGGAGRCCLSRRTWRGRWRMRQYGERSH